MTCLKSSRALSTRIVAAKLLVGRAEIVEVDAAKRADFAGHGLWIGHRGVNQRIQIEILDVERLAHMRAAVLQQLDNLVLILDRIEFGLQRFRMRRHLRERERGGKHLHENQIHRALPACRSIPEWKNFVVG